MVGIDAFYLLKERALANSDEHISAPRVGVISGGRASWRGARQLDHVVADVGSDLSGQAMLHVVDGAERERRYGACPRPFEENREDAGLTEVQVLERAAVSLRDVTGASPRPAPACARSRRGSSSMVPSSSPSPSQASPTPGRTASKQTAGRSSVIAPRWPARTKQSPARKQVLVRDGTASK